MRTESKCREVAASVYVALLVALVVDGCAWRTAHTEHYFGPVLFRYTRPREGNAYVTQVKNFLFSFEGGNQWGLSVGPSGRTAIAPRRLDADNSESSISSMVWTRPLSPSASPDPGEWNWSLLYLRGDEVPKPTFVERWRYGINILIGRETCSLGVGISSTTRAILPENAVAVLSFDDGSPVDARYTIWAVGSDDELPVPAILEELQ